MSTATLNQRFEEALQYAIDTHRSQVRKNNRTPFIAHLLAVAGMLIESGADEDTVIAGLLHDAVEDQGGLKRLTDIEAHFGERVASLVATCSDSFVGEGETREPWRTRKERYYRQLSNASREALAISCADKTHNLRAICGDFDSYGERIWRSFSAPPEAILRNYRQLYRLYEKGGVAVRLLNAMAVALDEASKRLPRD